MISEVETNIAIILGLNPKELMASIVENVANKFNALLTPKNNLMHDVLFS